MERIELISNEVIGSRPQQSSQCAPKSVKTAQNGPCRKCPKVRAMNVVTDINPLKSAPGGYGYLEPALSAPEIEKIHYTEQPELLVRYQQIHSLLMTAIRSMDTVMVQDLAQKAQTTLERINSNKLFLDNLRSTDTPKLKNLNALGYNENLKTLQEAIKINFGSFEAFRLQFENFGLDPFRNDSWVYLALEETHLNGLNTFTKLSIRGTASRDSVYSAGFRPLLVLKMADRMYLNGSEGFSELAMTIYDQKERYVRSFFEVVDWEEVQRRLRSPIKYLDC